MKKHLSSLTLLFLTAVFTASSNAQAPKSKDESFKEIAALSNVKKTEEQAKAYELSKDFLARFGKEKDEKVNKIRTFNHNYRWGMFGKDIETNNYAGAFALGRDILADEPDDVAVLMNLAYAGYNAIISKNDKTYVDESIGYSKKTLQLMEAGTMPKLFVPFKDKNEAFAFIYFADGNLGLEKDPKGSIVSIYRSTTYDAPIKDDPAPYNMIAAYYEQTYAKMAADAKAKVAAKAISDAEVKAEIEKENKVMDVMMDAYVRALKRSSGDAAASAQIRQRLTQIYKFRKKTEEGLPEYITYINTTPMPDPGKQ